MGIGFWLDPIGHVCSLIDDWSPRKCKTEKDYEKSLVKHLKAALNNKPIIAQYGSGRARGDIVVDGKVLIELKIDFDSTGKLNRLVGQLEGYEEEWGKDVLVVLCGMHDANLVRQLEKSIERRTGYLPGSNSYRLVVKGKAA